MIEFSPTTSLPSSDASRDALLAPYTTKRPATAAPPAISWGVARVQRQPSPPQVDGAGTAKLALQRIASPVAPKTLDERLFDRSAALKAQVASVAMHLQPEWRSGLFENLDRLLDPEEWEFDDLDYPDPASFATFLRMAIYLGHTLRPGLGMSDRGTIVAVWLNGRDKLSVECLPADRLRWVLTTFDNEERQSVAGITPVKKLGEILSSFKPERWFGRKD